MRNSETSMDIMVIKGKCVKSKNDALFTFTFLFTSFMVIASAWNIPQKTEIGSRLAHECVRLENPPKNVLPVVMLHGVTDTKETWKGIFENIPLLTHRKACIYDARDHGDSEWNNTFDYEVLADDLGSFMRARNMDKAAVVGHSLGGYTAMQFALTNPTKVERLFLEDITPTVPDRVNVATRSYLKTVKESISVVPDDADADTAVKIIKDYFLQATNKSAPEFLFYKFPLHRRDGKWQWKTNFDVIAKAFDDPDSLFGTLKGRYDGKTFVLYGTQSIFRVFERKDDIRKLFPNVEFFAVEGAEHLIHPYYPVFLDKMISFLK